MRRKAERLGTLVVIALTSLWPIMLAGIVAGPRGVQVGFLAYLSLVGLLTLMLVFGGIRGILQ